MTTEKCSLIAASGAERTRYGEVPRYTEGLYDLNHQLYAWLVPNGSWGEANAGLVVGDGESLLVDTLWDVGYTRAMLETMRPLTDRAPLRYLVNTHADGDHFWGNQLASDCDIITSSASYEEMMTTKPRSMIMLGKMGRVLSTVRLFNADKVGHWFQSMVAPYDFAPVRLTPASQTFDGDGTLQVGGREVRLLEVGPAHTQGDLMVYVPEARTLYSGDVVFIESTPVIWAGPLENWLAALDRILDLDVDLIVPGHGPLTDKDGVKQVKAYWQYISAEVCACFDSGISATEAARRIVLSKNFARQPFATWNSPERIMTNTHTLYRHLQGRTRQPSVSELLNIMRKQALLAHCLPQAQPAAMRKR